MNASKFHCFCWFLVVQNIALTVYANVAVGDRTLFHMVREERWRQVFLLLQVIAVV